MDLDVYVGPSSQTDVGRLVVAIEFSYFELLRIRGVLVAALHAPTIASDRDISLGAVRGLNFTSSKSLHHDPLTTDVSQFHIACTLGQLFFKNAIKLFYLCKEGEVQKVQSSPGRAPKCVRSAHVREGGTLGVSSVVYFMVRLFWVVWLPIACRRIFLCNDSCLICGKIPLRNLEGVSDSWGCFSAPA